MQGAEQSLVSDQTEGSLWGGGREVMPASCCFWCAAGPRLEDRALLESPKRLRRRAHQSLFKYFFSLTSATFKLHPRHLIMCTRFKYFLSHLELSYLPLVWQTYCIELSLLKAERRAGSFPPFVLPVLFYSNIQQMRIPFICFWWASLPPYENNSAKTSFSSLLQ